MNLEVFLNSNLLVGLTTLLTGLLAYIVYIRQKEDSKIQAARVLLTEVRIAEERIDSIRDKIASGSTLDLPPIIFPTKSWKKYSHLFISDFDQDELRLINDFYDHGEQIEEFIKRDLNFFWINVEERSRVSLQKLADFIVESINQPQQDQDNYISSRERYLSNAFDKHNRPYSPQRTLNGIRKHLPKMSKITTSSCGPKLKSLAKFDR